MPWKKTDTGVIHFVSEKEGLWAQLLAEETGLSPQKIQELLQLGSIYLNDQRIYQDSVIHHEDYLRIHSNPRRYPVSETVKISSHIVFENADLLILDKPSGLPCHATVDNVRENVLALLKSQVNSELLLTHRLDVATSGLLVFAKNKISQNQFHEILKSREIRKLYQAHVRSPGPEMGLHEHHMLKTEFAPKEIRETASPQTQNCLLKILNKTPLEENVRLEIELLTGRTHQIRAQLNFMGYPIVDDQLYLTGSNFIPDERISLKCVELSFHWNNSPLTFRLSDL